MAIHNSSSLVCEANVSTYVLAGQSRHAKQPLRASLNSLHANSLPTVISRDNLAARTVGQIFYDLKELFTF